MTHVRLATCTYDRAEQFYLRKSLLTMAPTLTDAGADTPEAMDSGPVSKLRCGPKSGKDSGRKRSSLDKCTSLSLCYSFLT